MLLPALREARDALINVAESHSAHIWKNKGCNSFRSLLPLLIVQKAIAQMNKPDASKKLWAENRRRLGPNFVMKYSGKDALVRFGKTSDAGTVCVVGYKF